MSRLLLLPWCLGHKEEKKEGGQGGAGVGFSAVQMGDFRCLHQNPKNALYLAALAYIKHFQNDKLGVLVLKLLSRSYLEHGSFSSNLGTKSGK